MIKKYGYRLVGIMLSAIIVIGSVLTYQLAQEDEDVKIAEASSLLVDEYDENNPLTVIEIVPYIMYAQLGYHIEGGEIVDYKQMEKSTELSHRNPPDPSGKDMTGLVGSFCGTSSVRIEIIGDSAHPLYAFYSNEYFKRHSVGLEDEYDEWDKLLKKRAIRKRLIREINETKDDTYKEGCQKTLEQYSLTQKEEELLDMFESVKVVYKAVLISEVNKNPKILENADLLMITGTPPCDAYTQLRGFLPEEYNKKLKNCTNAKDSTETEYEKNMKNYPFSYDEQETLSWNSADYIFRLSSEVGGAPVIMDKKAFMLEKYQDKEKKTVKVYYTALDSNNVRKVAESKDPSKGEDLCGDFVSGNNNAYKLYIMLYQKDPYEFRNDYYRYIKTINNEGVFELQENDARTYWDMATFFDYIEGVNETYHNSANKGETIKNNQVLITNGLTWNSDTSYFSGFLSGTAITLNCGLQQNDSGERYYGWGGIVSKDVLEFFGPNKNSISPAEAIRFLLMKRNASKKGIDKESLNVLEIEPSNEFTMNESTIKSYFLNYKGDIEISYMTSAEFNSTNVDLAGTYDLVYMGDNTGGLSLSQDNNYTYMKLGDNVTITSVEASQPSTTQYSGNDITNSKRRELVAYLDAGLPMIMADSLFNNEKVDHESNMYQFISKDIKSESVKDQVIEQSKAEQTPAAATSQLIPYLNAYRPSVTNIKVSYSETSLSVNFTIGNMKELAEGETLVAKLYAVLNGTSKSQETQIGRCTISNDGTYTIQGTDTSITKADAAISYRLVVEKSNDQKRYSIHTGTKKRKNTNVKTIRVLQIAPKTTTIDLTSTADITGRMIDKVTDENIEVTMITVNKFEELYDSLKEGTRYKADDLLTNQLIGYDVVVFGFSENYPAISNANGALDNVIDFIKCNGSVIFTNGVLQPVKSNSSTKTKQAYATLRELAGMKHANNGFTYAYLNKNKIDDTSYTMYNCSNGDSRSDSAQNVTLVNQGTVSIYPYEINMQTISQKTTAKCNLNNFLSLTISNQKVGIWQLNLEQVTGYYALADNDTTGRKQFSSSPNDIQNNYYLYNNGTVWYSGIGSNKLTSSNEEEAKLFVNTIIAAYRSAAESPSVDFVGTNKDSSGNHSAFVDADTFSNNIQSGKTLTFIPHDVQGKSLKTTIFVQSGDSIEQITSVGKKGGSSNIQLSGEKLSSDVEYDVTIPAKLLNGSNPTLYIYVQNENGIGMASCQIVRRVEFDLD